MSSLDFDFQIGKWTRLRGRGPLGLAALVLVLVALLLSAWFAGPSVASGLRGAISHGISALDKAWNSKAV